MGTFGDGVTLVNRTSKTLSCKWNGIDYTLPPGKMVNCPALVAKAAIEQNKLMGSVDPNNPTHFISLFGIEGNKKFPCTKLEQSDALEVIDRSKLAPNARKAQSIDVGGATYFDAYPSGQSIDMSNEIAARE